MRPAVHGGSPENRINTISATVLGAGWPGRERAQWGTHLQNPEGKLEAEQGASTVSTSAQGRVKEREKKVEQRFSPRGRSLGTGGCRGEAAKERVNDSPSSSRAPMAAR